MPERKPTVLVDFDGVIHRYSHGWMDGTCYDEPVEGAREHLEKMEEHGYRVVIFSSRDSRDVEAWLRANRFPPYEVTNEKLPAVALIDDRAIRFLNWDAAFRQLIGYYPPRMIVEQDS